MSSNVEMYDGGHEHWPSALAIGLSVLDDLGVDSGEYTLRELLAHAALQGIEFGESLAGLVDDEWQGDGEGSTGAQQTVDEFFGDDTPLDYTEEIVVPLSHGRVLRDQSRRSRTRS